MQEFILFDPMIINNLGIQIKLKHDYSRFVLSSLWNFKQISNPIFILLKKSIEYL